MIKQDKRGEQLTRCLTVVGTLAHKTLHELIVNFVGEVQKHLTHMPDGTLSVLVHIADAFLQAGSEDPHLPEPVLSAVFHEAKNRTCADLCNQVHGCIEKYPHLKQ